MALQIEIVLTKENTGPLKPWFDLWDQIEGRKGEAVPLKDVTYIRMPGTSQSGPCAECAQFFFMEHDGSGQTVPLIPLHLRCVCVDTVKQLADLTDSPPEPQPKGGWIENVATPQQRESILGKGRAALLESGATTVARMYEGGKSPLSSIRTLGAIASGLQRASKSNLIKAAKAAGLTFAASATRQEIINGIIGRRTL